LVFWEVPTGKELKKLPTGNQTWVSYMYFSPDGKTLAVHSNPTTVSLWDWAEGKERVLNMPAQQNGFVGIDSTHHGYFSRDGKIFGCGGGIQHPIILWLPLVMKSGVSTALLPFRRFLPTTNSWRRPA
jgi:WD40 repeat protein